MAGCVYAAAAVHHANEVDDVLHPEADTRGPPGQVKFLLTVVQRWTGFCESIGLFSFERSTIW